jgi:hypothetical protein
VKLQKQIPVEPLDEERLTNIERKLVIAVSTAKQTRAPRRLFGFATAVGAAAAAVLVGWTLHGSRPAVAVVEAAPPQHVAVATDAEHSTLTLDDATIASDPATKFDVMRGGGRVVVDMLRGRLDLAVQHRAGRVLVIRVGETEIEDIGTRFSVAYDGLTVDVRVTEGEVKVTRAQQVTHVTAGNAWTSTRGLVALAELEVATSVVSAPAVPIVPIGPIAPIGPIGPVAVADRAPVQHALAPHPRVATAEPLTVVAPHPASVAAVDPYVELRTAIRKVPLEFAPNIDGHSDAASEIAKLKKVAYSPTTLGPEASQAMYQIAVLLYRPLGQDVEALRTLDVYTRRFNGGKELHAALWLRVRIECSHAFDESCRRAAYSYQHEQTSGEASSVAIRITNAQ